MKKILTSQDRHSASWIGKNREFNKEVRNVVLAKTYDQYLRSKKKILDLGCGDGLISQHLLQRGLDVYSADYSSEAVQQTRKKGIKSVKQFDFSRDKFPYQSHSLDFVTWNDNAEHLLEPGYALSEIHRVLKSKGKVFITVPNMGYWWYRLYYVLKGNVIGTDGIRPNGYINQPWEWEHIRFFNTYYLVKFLEAHGFRICYFQAYNYTPWMNLIVPIFPQLFGQGLLVVGEKK